MSPKSYEQGQLRLAIMGDLLRHPGAKIPSIRERVEVTDPAALNVILRRLEERGMVRRIARGSWMLTRAGIEHLAQVRTWVSA